MNIAFDVSPIEDESMLSHRVRGTGFYIRNLKKALLTYQAQNKFIFFTRNNRFLRDVDIVHYPYFEPFFLTLPLKKRFPTVVTIHDLIPFVFKDFFPAGLKGTIIWQVQKRILKHINGIISDSQCSKKDIVRFVGVPEDKIYVVYLAAGEEFEKMKSSSASWQMKVQSLRKKYNLPEKFVLYVGDVTWNKNLPRLVEAIKKINVPLVMVGKALTQNNFDRTNPWNQDLVKVQKSTENDKRFIRLGFLPTEDLVSLYNVATVFVIPSLYEGFGLPLLEAMSCGCPAVVSPEGSLPEAAEDAALYVDAYDVLSMANGIGELYFNKDLQHKLSQKGLAQVKKFSWENTAKETIKAYETILGTK